jgi:hypothetical protein
LRSEAVALLGAAGESRKYYDGEWIVFADCVLCFATIGHRRDDSSFDSPASFAWATCRPCNLHPDPDFWFLPPEAVDYHEDQTPIWLFARLAGWEKYICLGRLSPCFQAGHWDGVYDGMFDLSPEVPDSLWPAFRGVSPDAPDRADPEVALRALNSQSSFPERFAALQGLVEYWHGPIIADDAYSDDEIDGIAVPLALHRWYGWAGRRESILSVHNQFFAPQHLCEIDGKLVFQMENQGVYLWGTLVAGDDPPVFVRENRPDAPWQAEDMSVTEFLIDACLESVRLTEGRTMLPPLV